MNRSRTNRGLPPPRSLRSERGAAAAVAQYIHDLSARHAGTKTRRSPEEARTLAAQRAREALAVTR